MALVDYEKEMIEKRLENLKLIREPENKKFLDLKIKNFVERFGGIFSYDVVYERILKDDMFAAFFIVDPQKQSLHQKLAFKALSENSPGCDFKVLPGSKGFYVFQGKVLPYKDFSCLKEAETERIKSLDFSWTLPTKVGNVFCFASHKHTKQNGGAQDNQYFDLISFMQEARLCSNPQYFFLAIADGPYYKSSSNRKSSETRFDFLMSLQTDFCRVARLEDVPKILSDHRDALEKKGLSF